MARWEPDAAGRLSQAALELFAEAGYDRTTVEDIATRAGVTKRTFFRHYADKREVLFGSGDEFRGLFLDGLRAVPADAPPMAAIAATLETAGSFFEGRHEHAVRRHLVIAGSAELRERELVKLAGVADLLAAGLRDRGVPEPAASIAAETGMAVFRTTFDRWVAADGDPDFQEVLRESLRALRSVTEAPAAG